MITTGSLPNYLNSVYDITLSLDSPISGFEFSLMETGIDSTFKTSNLVSFSGSEGYLFDQSGHFFGGYESGKTFSLKVFYDHTNETFTYYKDDLLIANKMLVTGVGVVSTGSINHVSFTKYADSEASVSASGVIS
jgi:hypothetical protein